jgi:hypothetical protein
LSEYQYVAFRAIDGPVSESNLKFMEKQSSRAEITPWSFENEYHFGDFRGDAGAMLRRGYDFHFHYANFGIRKLMIRLPNGLPDAKAAAPYLKKRGAQFSKDNDGPGGILSIEPFFEAGELEDLWELDGVLDRLLALREEILGGDLRPLYLAHVAIASDSNHDPEEEKSAPVPAGLGKLSDAQQALAELYGLSEALIAAAAQNAPALPEHSNVQNRYAEWIGRQPEATKNDWIARLMADPRSAVRREILAEFQKSKFTTNWPTAPVDRTIAELHAAAEEVQQELDRKRAEKATRQRAKKLSDMATDPTKTLRKTEELVKQRSTASYRETATLLADLRDALAGSADPDLPEKHARKLTAAHPTLRVLTSELRRKGFLKK